MPTMNLPETMPLQIETRHIEQGTPQDEKNCPIARAMFEFVYGHELDWTNWEAFQDYALPEVLEDEAEIAGTVYRVPPEGRSWMAGYDNTGTGVPTTIVLVKKHLD